MATEEEIAWVAGILEGEGCFSFNDPKNRRYPTIRIEITDFDVAHRLEKILQCGQCYMRKAKKPHHKDLMAFQITKSENAIDVMQRIRPWMCKRRGQRIDELIAAHNAYRSFLKDSNKSASVMAEHSSVPSTRNPPISLRTAV